MKKGQPIIDWGSNPEMGEQEITTARVFLTTGFILGALVGAGTVWLI